MLSEMSYAELQEWKAYLNIKAEHDQDIKQAAIADERARRENR